MRSCECYAFSLRYLAGDQGPVAAERTRGVSALVCCLLIDHLARFQAEMSRREKDDLPNPSKRSYQPSTSISPYSTPLHSYRQI
jgi:hypothetical protein